MGKKNRDVLSELHNRGFKTLNDSMLSSIINGHYNYGMAPEVLEEIKKIIDGWESENENS
jgi:hypothetical protein